MIKKAIILVEDSPHPLSEVAGLSLIKRAVLSSQKAGIEEIWIVEGDTEEKLYESFMGDKRLKSKIKWIRACEKISSQALNGVMGKEVFLLLKDEIRKDFLLITSHCLFDHKFLHSLLEYPLNSNDKAVRIADTGICLCTPYLFAVMEKSSGDNRFSFDDGIKALAEKNMLKTYNNSDGFIFRISSKSDISKAKRWLYATLTNPDEGFLERVINRKFSILITRLLIKTPVTPNHITVISILIGLAAAFFLSTGEYSHAILGSFIFLISTILDCTDGEIARLRYQESKYGSLLDIIGDNVVHLAIFCGITIGVYRKIGEEYILILGALAIIGALFIFFILLYNMTVVDSGSDTSSSLSAVEKREYGVEGIIAKLINRDFVYIIIVFAIIDILDWFLWISAIGANLVWMIILFMLFAKRENYKMPA